jgi:chromosome segregation ATPase
MIPIKYFIGGAVVAAAVAGGYVYRSSLIDLGYKKAQGEFQIAQSDRLREQIRETSRLQGVVQEKQDAYNTSLTDVETVRARLRNTDSRLRKQKAEFSSRLAAASAESIRDYAKASEDNFGRCRASVERFGFEAATCSAAARALVSN